jgi:hypothetical protein
MVDPLHPQLEPIRPRGNRRTRQPLAALDIDGELSSDQALEMWMGPSECGSAFRSDQDRQRLWQLHGRDFVGRMPGGLGRRPYGYWRHEAAIPFPGRDRERAALWALGVLDPDERAALEREWKAEFDRSILPGFRFTLGPGRILRGAAARRACYRDADIPPKLLREWKEAHRRAAAAPKPG